MKTLVAVAVVAMAFGLAAPAMAQEAPATPGGPGETAATAPSTGVTPGGGWSLTGMFAEAGLAMFSPFGPADSVTCADVGFKVLPIEKPAKVDFEKPLTIFQQIGATMTGDLLFPLDKINQLNIGASLPILSQEMGVVTGRLGVGYVRSAGAGVFLKGGIAASAAQTQALAAGKPDFDGHLVYSVGPGTAMIAWTKDLK